MSEKQEKNETLVDTPRTIKEVDEKDVVVSAPSGISTIIREFKRDKTALVAAILLIVIFLTIIIWSFFISKETVTSVSIMDQYLTPGTDGHLLGTDEQGRDIVSMLIASARNSLMIAFMITLIGQFFGIIIGTVTGYFRGIVDTIIMRIIDFWTVLPFLMIIIVLVSIVTKYNEWTLIWIIGLFSWQGTTRLIRSKVLSEADRDYVRASKTSGSSNFMIIFREILPNLASIIIVDSTLTFAGNIGIETTLSFLGFGLPNGTPSLGTMISAATDPDVLSSKPYVWAPAALLIIVITVGISFVGQVLRRTADARQRLG
ncbi:ABC transporter permease [Periweissella cryptocerci]|uniref:ABC transporter permease n=1 Tax=Periweissella cryptocerci TaxID=2506420 RepID=A0A4P6YUT5_9LACO|nr:ABC transporter permease [Periweissella cryptocerci]QBO36520.1 ABC transporter permease [Periweissella cryptocerci]